MTTPPSPAGTTVTDPTSCTDPAVFTGPLAGIRILELGSIGPGPFGAMLLADLGADVIRLDRAQGANLVGPNADFRVELLHRGRRSVAVDLKRPKGAEVVLQLVERADALLEGFRPGVTERLGVGPAACLARNPRLVYGRITGYGQDGPMAQAVGHDINYVAQSGLLSMIGREGQPPTVPLSLVGDFGGGGYPLALGVLAALLERTKSGRGQVIDAAMTEGAALLGTPFFGFSSTGTWRPERGTNLVDTGAPFYDCYQTADDGWLSVGALEPKFYADLLLLLELPTDLAPQYDRTGWPRMRGLIADALRTRTREQWMTAAEGLSPCVAAVLAADEAPGHPHNAARHSFIEVDGVTQPAPTPRFSRTPATVDRPPPLPGEHTVAALSDWGIEASLVSSWLAAEVVVENATPQYLLSE
jgi:alpha-methylacyl-CoA racemase